MTRLLELLLTARMRLWPLSAPKVYELSSTAVARLAYEREWLWRKI